MIIDFSESIAYNGLDLNDCHVVAAQNKLSGITTEEVRFLSVDGYGYREKRSLADGFDYGPTYLGKRDIYMRGVIFGTNLFDLAEKNAALRGALTPTAAYRADPINHGFLPLEFAVPYWVTNVSTYFRVYARPYEQPGHFFLAEQSVVSNGNGVSQIWEARFECRDPRFYANWVQMSIVDEDQFTPWNGSATLSSTFTVDGNGEPPVVITIAAHTTSTDMVYAFTGFSTSFSLNMPAGEPPNTVLTFDSGLKVVTIKRPGLVEVLRMDLVTFASGKTWPTVSQGTQTITATLTSASAPDFALSRIMFQEAWY